MLEDIFPEFKESKDEKIKNTLINLVKRNGTAYYINQIHKDDIFAWVEKQGKKVDAIENFDTEFEKQVSRLLASVINKEYEYTEGFVKWVSNSLLGYAKHEIETKFIATREKNLKKKSDNADKVEPKFKVGDWIVCCDYEPVQIIGITKNDYYEMSNGDGRPIHMVDNNPNIRLWTIQDAKDGDVLSYVTDEGDLWIMIYWSLYKPYKGHVHYHALLVDNVFTNEGTCCISIGNLKPSTKEQRDLLEKAMTDAGYTFDFNKKDFKERVK